MVKIKQRKSGLGVTIKLTHEQAQKLLSLTGQCKYGHLSDVFQALSTQYPERKFRVVSPNRIEAIEFEQI